MKDEPRKRSSKRFAWFVVAATFGAGAIWALVLKGRHDQAPPAAEKNAGVDQDQMARVQAAIEQLKRGQGDPESLSAQRAALNDLLTGENVPAKLTAVLAAVAADPSDPSQDPLWPDLIRALSAVWQGDMLGWGLDAMQTETRPRVRRALISSFANLAQSERAREMTHGQSQTLTNFFIDSFGQLPSAQQPEVTAALRKIAGNDVADVLLGKGLHSEDELEIHRANKLAIEQDRRAIEEGHRILQQQAEAEAKAQAKARAAASPTQDQGQAHATAPQENPPAGPALQ